MAIAVSEIYEYGGFWSLYVFLPGRGIFLSELAYLGFTESMANSFKTLRVC